MTKGGSSDLSSSNKVFQMHFISESGNRRSWLIFDGDEKNYELSEFLGHILVHGLKDNILRAYR